MIGKAVSLIKSLGNFESFLVKPPGQLCRVILPIVPIAAELLRQHKRERFVFTSRLLQ